MQPGYLHNWIEKNAQKLWTNRREPPRFSGDRAIDLAQQDQFQLLGECLLKDMLCQLSQQKPMEFRILADQRAGAWVVWPAECYGILLTAGLLENIQQICGQADALMRSALQGPVGDNFLRDLWGDLPNTNEHRWELGSLLAHIAFTFIVNHELAHAVLGHERAKAYAGASDVLSQESEFLSEFAAAIDDDAAAKHRMASQALEADADIMGLYFTRSWMSRHAIRFESTTPASTDVMGVVWKALLIDPEWRQLLVSMGVAIGLLALLPDLELDRLAALQEKTHPPIPARLLMLLHIDIQFDVTSGQKVDRSRMTSAILVAAALVSMVVRAQEAVKKLKESGAGREHARDEAHTDQQEVSANSAPAEDRSLVVEAALERIAIPDAVAQMDEIGEHFKKLALEMEELSKITRQYARYTDASRVKWWRANAD